jgi:hypothetical protein
MIGARPDIWLVCGSQHLYGPGPLEEVAANARHLAATLDDAGAMPLPVASGRGHHAGGGPPHLPRGERRSPPAPA